MLAQSLLYANETTPPNILENQEIKPKTTPSKSGFFLGIEANLGSAKVYQYSTFYFSEISNPPKTTNHFAFDGGLKLGYQHYFDKEALGVKQAYGVSFSAFIGAGVSYSQDFMFDDTAGGEAYIKSEYLPIKAGFDLNFLWDFLEKGNHTLGLTAGFAYRFNYYKSMKNSQNAIGYLSNGTISAIDNYKFDDLSTNGFYPQIGLHYYYGNHQFDLNYRFGGILTYGSKVSFNDLTGFTIRTQIFEDSYLSFGYSYRF